MPKNLIKRFIPSDETLKNHKALGIFGKLLFAPNLWHLNKRSFSGAFAVGLFCAFLPMPFQMVVSAAGALLFRVNLAVSVALVWVTNPITIPPIFYFAYLVGTWILNLPAADIEFSLSVEWMQSELSAIWQPLLLGSLVCGIISAILGNLFARMLWRYLVVKSWQKRKQKRANQTL